MSFSVSSAIRVKSPTRVDLAGGTLDLWPLYLFMGGAKTTNLAIDIWTSAELEPRSDERIILESTDLLLKCEYENLEACLEAKDSRIRLLQAQISFWRPSGGFSLKTSSESPVGGGLGGSSSLTISLMKAFQKFSQFEKSEELDVHKMVQIAHDIEAEVLNTPTGTQDYYPAVSGGLNILNYSAAGIQQTTSSAKGTPLETHFLLVYTGRSHHSGMNNFEVMKAAVAKEAKTLQALGDLKGIAEEMVGACQTGAWSELPNLFQREFEARVRLAPAFSCPEILQLNELALQHGAEAVKICGAGGGGCVLVWVAPTHRQRVVDACQKAGFKVLSAKPVDLKS